MLSSLQKSAGPNRLLYQLTPSRSFPSSTQHSFKTNTMSADVITQIRTADASRGQGRRGRSRRNYAQPTSTTDRGSNNRNNRAKNEKNDNPGDNNREPAEQKSTTIIAAPKSETDGDSDICWICAEPVKYYSLSECNHRTCHVCALRLRALYKKTDCTFCKVSF
jgi:E3 ubiquitin-protein ligase ZNF598